mmetsp:Transcript_26940/g.75923  ORF Transcript_26940/g.75923 Transcript_26940/m.75923 type:complete len:85 (-) Transcript_26940:321-575(-)
MQHPTQPAFGHHTRRTASSAVEEDDEIDPFVDQQGCGRVYAKLEECLGENDRDWRLCQREVAALKECYSKAASKGGNNSQQAAS